MTARWMVGFALLSVLACGCRGAPPSFPPPGRDAGYECDPSGTTGCPSGQVCLQGYCYAACDTAHPCGPLESCMAGVCVASNHDAGPVDPCATTMCDAAHPFCRGGACLVCVDQTVCGGGNPVCDVGRGLCVPPSAIACAPCNNDLDCGGAGSGLNCVSLTVSHEKVCLPQAMGSACPTGFRPDFVNPASCVPEIAACTIWRAAIEGRACGGDADCAPAGAGPDSGFYAGVCFDSGFGSVCHYPCGVDSNCPPARPTCNTMVGGFCL